MINHANHKAQTCTNTYTCIIFCIYNIREAASHRHPAMLINHSTVWFFIIIRYMLISMMTEWLLMIPMMQCFVCSIIMMMYRVSHKEWHRNFWVITLDWIIQIQNLKRGCNVILSSFEDMVDYVTGPVKQAYFTHLRTLQANFTHFRTLRWSVFEHVLQCYIIAYLQNYSTESNV